MTGEAPRGQRNPRAGALTHGRSRTLTLALPPVGNYRSDMQIAAVTTNARLTVTLLTDRYTVSGERVHACACAATFVYRRQDTRAHADHHRRSRENHVEPAEFTGRTM